MDGIYVIRTNVPAEVLSSEQAVRNYKSLSGVERAFRSLKTVDLHVRPIHHRQPDRVRAHIFLCMLAYYVEWHMRKDLAPLLFDDEDKVAAEKLRASVVAPAQRSPSAQAKAHSKRTPGRSARAQFSNSAERPGHHRRQPGTTQRCQHPGVRHDLPRLAKLGLGLPPHRLALVLLVQPLLERREVVADRAGVHLAGPAIFSSASCQGRLCPISSMAFSRAPASWLP